MKFLKSNLSLSDKSTSHPALVLGLLLLIQGDTGPKKEYRRAVL